MAGKAPAPIAIIGMSCRFSGGTNSPEKLWDMLVDGRSGWSDVPSSRYNWKSFYHPHPEASGAHNQRGGNFIDGDIAEFDAPFFGIPPPEAHAMDPQQRHQLETVYEAFENGGITLEKVRGSNTAVYIAVTNRDYDRMIFKDTSDIAKYSLTGCGDATLCGRISYTFDLKGAAMTIDTGCSGSMVGLHQACQSLRLGESEMAIVGGTHLLLGPDLSISMSMLHMMNDDGKCYAFDSRGQGYGRSEGVAAVLLKRLDQALIDGDPIRAVIRNTGINQDGKTNGILLPSSESQQNLMETLYQMSGLDPKDTTYIEAHGTGTQAGDAAEINSINNVFCVDGKRDTSLYVGSIKANIGHTECTSGLAGLIKIVMMMERGLIPPVPDLKEIKPSLELESKKIKIPQQLEPWPGAIQKRASINSFGFGGTNAHAIIESTPRSSAQKGHVLKDLQSETAAHSNDSNDANGVNGDIFNGVNGTNAIHGISDVNKFGSSIKDGNSNMPRLIAVTARSEKSLHNTLQNLHTWMSAHERINFRDLAYTFATRRSIMPWRWTTIATSEQDLLPSLSQKTFRPTRVSTDNKIAFLFTGQGAQWFAMGRELMFTQSAFRDSMNRSDKILKDLGSSWSLLDALLRDKASSRINHSEIAQPASTAIQIALVDLLQSFNIRPQAVLGHSSGEIAAAYAAGFLSHHTALTVSFYRSFISTWWQQSGSCRGAMLASGLGEDEILPYIAMVRKGTLSVACVNSPSSTTISGDEVAIDELNKILSDDSIFSRKLTVDTAYHSHHMKQIAHQYLAALKGINSIEPSPNSIRFFSSVTGTEKTSGFGPDYWVANLISKVQFNAGLERLCCSIVPSSTASSLHHFIEIGPHAALSGPIRQTISQISLVDFKYCYYSSLLRDQDARTTVLNLAGKLFENGCPVNLEVSNSLEEAPLQNKLGILDQTSPECRVVTDLPPYSWDHSNRYWNESRLSKDYRTRLHPPHELLGLRIVSSNTLEPTWRNLFSVDSLPWLQEHVIDNFALFPGSGYLCMAMEAVRQMTSERQIPGVITKYIMRDITYAKALVIPDAPAKVEVQFILRPSKGPSDKLASTWDDFRVISLARDGSWSEHCSGSIMAEFASGTYEVASSVNDFVGNTAQRMLNRVSEECSEDVDSKSFYDGLRVNGIDYGENFSTIKKLRIGHCKALGTVAIPDIGNIMPSKYMQPHILHPATFDALMHIVLPLYSRHCSLGPVMLIAIDEVTISANMSKNPGDELIVACELFPAGPRSGSVDVSVFQTDDQGTLFPVVTLSHEEFRGIGEGTKTLAASHRKISYNMKWGADVDYLIPRSLATPEGTAAAEPSRTSDNLTSTLVEKVDSPSTLSSDNSLRRIYPQMRAYIRALGFKKPHMSILEIDAGTGLSTRHILHSLTDEEGDLIDYYDFTDVSSDSFDKARSQFQEGDKYMRYKILDIECDPIGQGFAEGSYDLIIAANGLSAKKSIATTLSNIRKLLKPGGRLISVEITNPTPADNCIQDTLQEQGSRFLFASQWKATLERASFRGIKMADNDDKSPVPRTTMIVSKAASPIYVAREVKVIYDTSSAALRTLTHEITSVMIGKGLQSSVAQWSSDYDYNDEIYIVVDDGSDPLLANTSSTHLPKINTLLHAAKSILWVSTQTDASAVNPEKGLITGMSRIARIENSTAKIVTLDIQQAIDSKHLSELLFVICTTWDELEEFEFAFRNDQLEILRLVSDTAVNNMIKAAMVRPDAVDGFFHQTDRTLKLHVEIPGLLDTILFVDEDASQTPLGAHELEIKPSAYAMNLKDLAVALGRAKSGATMAGEIAGVVTAVGSGVSSLFSTGDRVCGWGGVPYANRTRIAADLVHKLPQSLSFVEGASIPLAFQTAYQSLIEIAHIHRDQTVLIHSAAGAVGQAAVMIAQHVGAKIFATVGCAAKRQLLIEKYDLPACQIFSSSTTAFRKGIHLLTDAKGVDVILNSLAGDFLADSWACLAKFGTFVDIGKSGKGKLSMEPFDRNVTFASVDMSLLAESRPNLLKTLFAKVMLMFDSGHLKPVHPIVTLPLTDIAGAFRLMQGRKHSCKVVLTADDDTVVKMLPQQPPPLHLDASSTYVVAGGVTPTERNIWSFLACHGAKHILSILPASINPEEQHAIKREIQLMGANMHFTVCNLNEQQQLETAVHLLRDTIPHVRGIIQCDTELLDKQEEAFYFQRSVLDQISGTYNLDRIFSSPSLDFFITLSSVSNIIGHKGQVSCAARSAFQNAFAASRASSKSRFLSLNLGPLEASDENGQRQLVKQGYVPLKDQELYLLLGYAMNSHIEHKHRQIVVGFDRNSLSHQPSLRNPIFSCLPYVQSDEAESDATASASKDKAISAAQTVEEVRSLVSTALAKKLSALVALDYEDVDLDMPIADIGLDSLVAIEFKNWIGRSLSASMQTSEILDAPSITALATLVTERSTLGNNTLPSGSGKEIPQTMTNGNPNANANSAANGVVVGSQSSAVGKHEAQPLVSHKLPKMPIPDLETTMQSYLESICSFASKEELEYTSHIVNEFKKPGGLGPKLQQRLVERTNNPELEDWLSDLYNTYNFLDRRVALVPFSSFFFTHQLSKFDHPQADRAAMIAETAHKYKQVVDSGKLSQVCLNEEPISMELFQWLFNTVRRPRIGSDQMVKFPGDNYFLAMRHGHFYKVVLDDVSYPKLRATFQAILAHTPEETSWTSILTSDNRDSWAKNYQMLKSISPENEMCINMIEAAAFVICLDDASPSSASERAYHFHFGNGSNRWNDKCVQIAVCKNGVSGFIGDHSMLDANTVAGLNGLINAAILSHKPDDQPNSSSNTADVALDEYPLTTTFSLDNEISRIRGEFNKVISRVEHAFTTYDSIGATTLRAHHCPPNSAFQIAVNLAAWRYFGTPLACWETVSLGTFHHGRVELNQVVLPPVFSFLSAATATTNSNGVKVETTSVAPAELRQLFFAAARAHANSVTRAYRGRGYDRHMISLEQVRHADEPVPELWKDPLYFRTRAHMFMSHCHETGMLEKGFVLTDPQAIWVHYEVEEERVRFSVTGPKHQTGRFTRLIDEAAELIKRLVVEVE